MKIRILTLTLPALLWASCGQPAADTAIPEDPAQRKALLEEKRRQLAQLKTDIADLEALLGQEAGAKSEEEAQVVTTMRIQPTLFRRFTEIQGNIAPVKENMISSETGGRIVRLNVREGDVVRAGQVLAVTDMEPLKKQIEELEAGLSLATEVYDRQKRLWDQKIGSEIQFLQAKNNKERLEKSLAGLQAQLKKASIVAPMSGVIEHLTVEQGDVAAPGMPIMQLINTTDLKVIAEVPERYVGTVKSGEKVRVEVPAVQGDQTESIRQVGRVIHPSNRTFHLETSLANAKGQYKPNLLALVHIEDYRRPDALVVPVDVVQQEVGGKQFIFVADSTAQGPVARKAYVTTGESYDNTIVIASGLNAGDEIILRGARSLSENERLAIQNETHD